MKPHLRRLPLRSSLFALSLGTLGACAVPEAEEAPPPPAAGDSVHAPAGPEKVETVDHVRKAALRAAVMKRHEQDVPASGISVSRRALSSGRYRVALPMKQRNMGCPWVAVFIDNEDDFSNPKQGRVNANTIKLNSLPRLFDIEKLIPDSDNLATHADFNIFVQAGGIGFPPAVGGGTEENNDRDTLIEMCIEEVSSLPKASHDYAVVAIDDVCPAGSFWFQRFQDAQDHNNWSAVLPANFAGLKEDSKGNITTSYCFVPGTGNLADPAVPPEFADRTFVFGVNTDHATYWGSIHQDDEDSGNQNRWRSTAGSDLHGRMKDIVGDGRNTTINFRGSGKGFAATINRADHTEKFWQQDSCKNKRNQDDDAADSALGKAAAKNAIEALEKDPVKQAADLGAEVLGWFFNRKENARVYHECMKNILKK